MKNFIRIGIIFFWTFLIAIIFYFPSWKSKILPQSDKSLNIFAWGDLLDTEILNEFEKKTGIKINLSFYASNEELQVKMKATEGKGYDLIMPSDYAVPLLRKENLLQPLDHSKFNFWDTLYSALLNQPFDPENLYSIPFEWELFGFGVDSNFFKKGPLPDTWKAIFDPNYIHYQISMKNDPIEVFQFASNYLFGPLQSVNDEQFESIRQLLLHQRKWIVAYSDFRTDYYIATGNAPLAISTTSYIKRIQNTFPHIQFILPKEGSFVSIESFAISKSCKKQDYVYAFLNYLYRPESLIRNQKKFLFLPASDKILDDLDLDDFQKTLYKQSKEEFKKHQFFRNIAPQQKVRDLWIEIKSF